MIKKIQVIRNQMVAPSIFVPLSALMNHAAINITDPTKLQYAFPPPVRPILELSFSTYSPRFAYHEADKVLRKKEQQEIKRNNKIIASDRDAEQIIAFLDSIEKDRGEWTIYCNGEFGVAIARFVKALVSDRAIEIGGVMEHEIGHVWLGRLLSYIWSEMFKKDFHERKASSILTKVQDEHNANFEPTVRNEESPPTV